MEKMFQDYQDVAEFRMIYIREAHASDSNRPVRYAKEKGIKQQTKYDDRCTTAKMLIDDKQLTMPFLVDSMDNKTNEAYAAHPDRVFVVDTSGKIVVAAGRGPFGFKPGLENAKKWLAEYEKKNPASKSEKDGASKDRPAKSDGKGDGKGDEKKPTGEKKDSVEKTESPSNKKSGKGGSTLTEAVSN